MQTITEQTTLIEKIHSTCLKNNIIFASYRRPGEKHIYTMIQKTAEPRKLPSVLDLSDQKGFIIAPFQPSEESPVYLIRPDFYFSDDQINNDLFSQLEKIKNRPPLHKTNGFSGEVSRREYIAEIGEILKLIKKGEFEKAVLSRVHLIDGNYENKISRMFGMVCEAYPNAFVYVFKVGPVFWLGATPEPLICSENSHYKTVSLAATRIFNAANLDIGNWNKKERQEQEYVTTYIERVLNRLEIDHYEKIGPYPRKAGNLLHLCTDFEIPVEELDTRIGELVYNLHPTSSICGMPKEKALTAIKRLEKHNREYYAGFLGTINMEEKITLYVNLRCMKIYHDYLALYVGGGITADSTPEEEWEETGIKAETLKSIIAQLNYK